MTKWITKTDYVAGIRCPTWLKIKKRFILSFIGAFN